MMAGALRLVKLSGRPQPIPEKLRAQSRAWGTCASAARVRHWELHGYTDETGLVDELVVMIRPLSGVLALAEAMREELERTAG
jgi:hypothetical protein